jgi:hypothetical protein
MNAPNLRTQSRKPADPLRYFAKDRPSVKLTALLICKLPLIISAVLVGLASLTNAINWW